MSYSTAAASAARLLLLPPPFLLPPAACCSAALRNSCHLSSMDRRCSGATSSRPPSCKGWEPLWLATSHLHAELRPDQPRLLPCHSQSASCRPHLLATPQPCQLPMLCNCPLTWLSRSASCHPHLIAVLQPHLLGTASQGPPAHHPHLLAVLQARTQRPHPLWRQLHVTVEGQAEQLAAQHASTQRGVQVGVRLVQQRGQEVQPDLRSGRISGADN